MNFFVLIDDTPVRAARIPVVQSLQNTLTTLFDRQEEAFFANQPKEVSFSASHTPDDSEVAVIDDYPLPEAVVNALKNPLEQESLKLKADALPKIKGIFCGSGSGEKQTVRFQAFERRQFLDSSGISIFLSRGTFKRLEDPGLTLDTKLAAVHRGGRLFFSSFFVARRVLDLSNYFQEATDDQIEQFAQEPNVALQSSTTLTANADEWVRRKIALIRNAKVMRTVPPKRIVSEAGTYGLAITTKTVNRKLQIVFPDDKKELKELLRFLDQNYYTSGLTGDKWVANSKSPLRATARTGKKPGKRQSKPARVP
jgi:hypothetical protein